MNFYVDSGGTVIAVDPEKVYQGQAYANRIRLIGPFASTLAVTVGFTLPNGEIITPQLMTNVNGDLREPFESFSIWEYVIPKTITNYAGVVKVQFYVHGTRTVLVRNVETGKYEGKPQSTVIATGRSSFNVEKGVPIYPLDGEEAVNYETLLTDILGALSALQERYNLTNLENGEGEGSIRQRGTDEVPAAKVSGIQSVAFGGRRFDYDGDAEDVTSEVTANQSFSSGCGNKIINNSHWSGAIGKDNIIGQYIDEEGNLQDADLTYCVVVIGNGNKIANKAKSSSAKYFSGMAVGIGNELYGTKSFIQGSNNKIGSELSFISGYKNSSNAPRSTIFGAYNDISLVYAPSNLYNLSFGSYNLIQQTTKNKYVRNNILLGTNLRIVDKENQTVLGKYNEDKADLLLSVGNGSSDSTRSNAFEVLKDGRAKVYGEPTEEMDVVRLKDLETKLSLIKGIRAIEPVTALSTENISDTTLYLVTSGDDAGNEYIYVNGAWELIGTTKVDLSNYATLDGRQTITGAKTFKKPVEVKELTDIDWVDYSDGSLLGKLYYSMELNPNGIIRNRPYPSSDNEMHNHLLLDELGFYALQPESDSYTSYQFAQIQINDVEYDEIYNLYLPFANGTVATQEWVGYYLEDEGFVKTDGTPLCQYIEESVIGLIGSTHANYEGNLYADAFSALDRKKNQTTLYCGDRLSISNDNGEYELYLPEKSGTLATTDDCKKLYRHDLILTETALFGDEGSSLYISVFSSSSSALSLNEIYNALYPGITGIYFPYSNQSPTPVIRGYAPGQIGTDTIEMWLVKTSDTSGGEFMREFAFKSDTVTEL